MVKIIVGMYMYDYVCVCICLPIFKKYLLSCLESITFILIQIKILVINTKLIF